MENRRPSLIGPLILITIGVLFLLANMGQLPLTFWEIALRFWPLLLILIGLEVIFGRRSALGALVIVVLWAALVGGVLWYANAQSSGAIASTAAATDQISQPLGDVKSAAVDMNIGVSNSSVNALGSDSADLMNGTFRHSEGARMVKTYNVVGTEGRLALREESSNLVLLGTSISRWDVGLNPGVPLVLRVNGGLGRAKLDLSGLNVTNLAVDAGLGSLDVTTPKAGNVTMRVNGGIGSENITIPPGMAARIRVSAGLGGIRVDETRFPKFGDVYQSSDFSSAANKIDVDVDGGIGRISIQ